MRASIILLVALGSLLVGCSQTTRTVHTFHPTNVPETILKCPVVKKSDFPPKDATNSEVHAFIKKLWNNNQLCGANMTAVVKYLENHNANVAELNKKSSKVK